MTHITAPRAVLLGLLALALAVTGLVGVAHQADAQEPGPYMNLERISARSFTSAGVAISKEVFPAQAEAAVLATTANFPDALSSSSLAAAKNGPVLFTDPDRLPDDTAEELQRVVPAGATVYLMGGVDAVSNEVATQLQQLGYGVQRVEGPTRLETAVSAARHTGMPANGHVIIARAFGPSAAQDRTTGWVDSVSCGAYAAKTRTPILLTETDRMSNTTAQALGDLGVRHAIVCGGVHAVGTPVVDELRARNISHQRIEGVTRVETAIDGARKLFGFNDARNRDYIVINGYGENYGFGLAATPLAAQRNAPILLVSRDEPTACTDGSQPSRETLCYLQTAGSATAQVTVIGSGVQISRTVADALAQAAGGERAQALARPTGVTASNYPGDDGTRLVVKWGAVDDPDGILAGYNVYVSEGTTTPTQRQGSSPTVGKGKTEYVVTGLKPGQPYSVAVTSLNRFSQESEKSQTATGTPVNDVPAAVKNFSATAGDGRVSLTWGQSPELDVAGYEIQRTGTLAGSCTNSWATIKNNDGRANTSYTDQAVSNGTSYCYRIRAFDRTTPEPQRSEWTTAPENPVTPSPGAPSVTVTSPQGSNNRPPSASWDTLRHRATWPITWNVSYTGGNNGDLRVRIQWSGDGGATYTTIVDNLAHGPAGSNQAQGSYDWHVTPDLNSDEGRIRVTVVEPSGDGRAATSNTQNFDFSRAPRPVQGTAAVVTGSGADRNVRVTWDANPELSVTGYQVQRKVVSVTSSTNQPEACNSPTASWNDYGDPVSGRTNTTFVDGQVTPNTTLSQQRYCYRVRALRQNVAADDAQGSHGGAASTTVPAVASPDISLRSPSNNETILTGSQYKIRWTVSVPPGGSVHRVRLGFCVDYRTNNPPLIPAECAGGWQHIQQISQTSAGDGDYLWNVPSFNQGDNQRGAVRAQVYATSGQSNDSPSATDIRTGIRFP